MGSKLKLIIAGLALLAGSPALAGSANVFGFSDPAADYAIDSCKSQILALEPYVATANIQAYLPQLLAMSADQLADYLPKIDAYHPRDPQEAEVNRMGGCFARALIRFKRGQASSGQAASSMQNEPSPRQSHSESAPSSKPASSSPPNPGKEAAAAAIDEVLTTPTDKVKDKKGEDAKDCLEVASNATQYNDMQMRNNCPYMITVGWCAPGVDCRGNMFANMQNLASKGTYPVPGTAGGKATGEVQAGACKGFNTLRMSADPPYSYTCSAELK